MTMPARCCSLVLLAGLLPATWNGSASAQGQVNAGIYSCTDAKGRRHTSDRPIPECQDRESRVLNADGSVRKVVPPAMSTLERAEQDAREQKAVQAQVARQDAIRRDRNLMLRYPNQATHEAARQSALADVNASIAASEGRLAVLVEERKTLAKEASDPDRPPTARLTYQIGANKTAIQAQTEVVQNQKADLGRLESRYDRELALLKRLWAGAPPGSVEEPASAPSSAAAALPNLTPASASATR